MELRFGTLSWPGSLLILWLSLSCLGRQQQGAQYVTDSCICTLEYAPVCCGGKEYGNQCGADCAGASNCRKGACGSEGPSCPCTREYRPVCCGGVQYSNQCLADCAGATNCEKTSCESPEPVADVFVTCAPGSAQARCRGDVCEKSDCPSNPAAVCNINPCGDALFDGKPVDIPICGAYYVSDGALVEECTDFEDGGNPIDDIQCQGSSPLVNCFANPCDVSTCPAYPEAKCLASYCNKGVYRGTKVGPCGALYVDSDTGDVLDCEADTLAGLTCAPGSAQAKCLGDVCDTSKCPSNPKAQCSINPCGAPLYDGLPVEIPICGAYYVSGGALVEECTDLSGSGVSGQDTNLIANWTLIKIKQKKGLLPFPGAKATLTFTNEGPSKGSLSGNNGCNAYNGAYDVPIEGKLEIGPLGQTKIGCLGPQAKLEGLYMPLLGEVDGFKVGPKRLRLFQGKKKVLVFKKEED